MDEGKAVVEDLEQKLGKINKFQRKPPGTTGDASKLLDAAIAHVERRSKLDEAQRLRAHDGDLGEAKNDGSLTAMEVLAQLQAINGQLRAQVEGKCHMNPLKLYQV